MLTRLYIEALLIDEELADQVWEAWNNGEIDEALAYLLWQLIGYNYCNVLENDASDLNFLMVWSLD